MVRRDFRAALLAAASILALLPAKASAQIETVVVTAERRAQSIDKVPESISAFPKEKMDVLGVKDITDLVKFTPGVHFDTDTKTVSIRGIDSTAGSATTGIYIDDTPIQIRNLGFNSNSTLPAIFDLDRVEVLRGPQGTLFGAGSEGGTIRYITPQPSLDTFSIYSRAELSFTQSGSPSYEAGVAMGGPLSDTLGLRGSIWGREDGGFIDHVDYKTLNVIHSNDNKIDNLTGRFALAWQPVSNITITPAFYFQTRDENNADDYWVAISNPSAHVWRSGTPEDRKDEDRFVLPSLKFDVQLDGVEFISNASYFNRHENVNGYSGTLYNLSYFQQLVNGGTDPEGLTCTGGLCLTYLPIAPDLRPALLQPDGLLLPGYADNYLSVATITNTQENITEEVRLQSSDSDARFTWVIGGFYQNERQVSVEQINDPQLPALTQYLWGEDMATAWGLDLLANGDDYINQTAARNREYAAFANATYAITDQLKLQAGARVAWTHFEFKNRADGPQNFGHSGGHGAADENPVTPMASLTYQITPDDMIYATYSKGYRTGGANAPTPPSCAGDLADLGLTSAPDAYQSDTVTNYEAGTKNSFFDRHVQVSASAFFLNWNNIQQSNYLPNCGIQYTANLGKAESKGFDLQADILVTDELELDATLGYVDARYTTTAFAGPAPGPGVDPLTVKGEALPGTPWSFSFGAQYNTSAWGHDAYVRADYAYTGKAYGPGGGYASGTASFDAALKPDPAYSEFSVRTAMTFDKLNLALFAENLFDAHPQLNLSHQDSATLLFEAETLRPRTVGLTATYKMN